MPINTHDYLVQRGWKGKGTALKEGGIERPVVQAQKNNLKGLGKDRDDGFQFWDHVYSVAANAIQIKINDSDDEDSYSSSVPKRDEMQKLQVTQTGILSNRRPVAVPTGPVFAETPTAIVRDPSGSSGGAYDLLALAKREAAKKELYSRFHRGPVIHNDHEDAVKGEEGAVVPEYNEKQRRKEERRLARAERRKRKEGGLDGGAERKRKRPRSPSSS